MIRPHNNPTHHRQVFGNMGDDSGTGVMFTRNPSTGENENFGACLLLYGCRCCLCGYVCNRRRAIDVSGVHHQPNDPTHIPYKRQRTGEYLSNACGEDVVAGIRTPTDLKVFVRSIDVTM